MLRTFTHNRSELTRCVESALNPLSSVDAKRAFSFITVVDSQRTPLLHLGTFRATFMTHLFREWLLERLSEAISHR